MAADPQGTPPLLSLIFRHAVHHGRFYAALALGAAAYAIAPAFAPQAAGPIAADVFFLAFLASSWWLVFRLTDDDLARKADIEDEGAFIVTLLTLAAIAYTSFAIFAALNQKNRAAPFLVPLALAGAPLGWLTLQTVMALRYAHIYYRHDDAKGYVAPVDFPRCKEPGPWEFLYLSMVVGMTAQVADTNIQTSGMRRTVMIHSVVSFFFNTVLIAMAVNAVVALAS